MGNPRPAIYFDTSVYNHLIDDPEQARILSTLQARWDVWASFHDFTELADTAGSTRVPEKRVVDLIDLIKRLMEDKELLAHPWQLLQRALLVARSGGPTLRFGLEPSAYAAAISWDWIRDRPQEEIQAGQEWKKQLRREHGDWRKAGRSGLGLDQRDANQAPPLRDVLDHIFNDSEQIRFHFQDGLESAGATPQQIADAEATVRDCPVWRPFLVAEVVRRYLSLTGPPAGDLTDTMHATYLPVVTCFVTADGGQKQVFEETMRWCYPHGAKHVLDYSELRAGLQQM